MTCSYLTYPVPTYPHISICITSQLFTIVSTFSPDWSTLESITYTATHRNNISETATIPASDATNTTLTWGAGP